MSRERRQLNQWLASLRAAQLAALVAGAVFVPLLLVFLATGEKLGSAAAQAVFWAIFAVLAALLGRALGSRRRGAGGPGPPR
jgi:membrane protein implicated in regulation of membrane protease activity